MAFVRVDKYRQIVGATTSPIVTMGAYLADGKRHASKSVMIRISRPLVTLLGWEVIDRTLYINVNEGTGSDKGYLQVTQTTPGAAHSRRMTFSVSDAEQKQGLAVSLVTDSFKHYVLNECPVSAAVVEHMIDDGALIIECPDWLRFDPTTEKEPEPEPIKKPTLVSKVIVEDDRMNRQERRAVANKIARALKR